MFTGVTMVGREPYNLSGFCNCTNLNSIVLPPSVTKIGYCAFQSTSISIIDLKYITDISYSAFYACKQLAGVIDMPNLVTKNIITVFADTAINEVKNLGKVERLGNDSFNNGNFTEAMGKRCMNDHYGVSDINAHIDRRHTHTKAVVRVYHMMTSIYKGEAIKYRYLPDRTTYELESCFNKALTDFELTYQKYDYSPKTIDAYKKTAYKFLVYASQHGYTDFKSFSAFHTIIIWIYGNNHKA